MSGTIGLQELWAGVEESAGLIDVTCSPERMWPVLTAYEDAIAEAVIAFRVATNARHEGEFDVRFTVPWYIDPYLRAREHNLVTETGHPVESLLADIREQCPVDLYGVDAGVVGGFRKIWVYFPADAHQSLAGLAGLESMPPSLAANLGFFTERGIEGRVDLIAIDYHSRTINLYFTQLPEALRRPEAVLAMHRDIGLPEPSEQMLRFCERTFGFYATLTWDSPGIKRIAFSVKTQDPLSLPARLGPKIEQFVKSVPYGVDDPKMVYAAMTSSGEEYYKLQSYFRFQSRSRLDQMPSADHAA
ncbi:aromatic prenyltransferase [Streptomyces justiciae]|uniref:Aromatic prenyltransferase n=1 Tax=Streptomyces justiciae TaxID=2780140 RepID=A0ABU3M8W2_9ACTN|nr:aromatic prenyltransferase [Streptomyces justiciae]MDT7847511.1 aromatic prenyltransferase [Streptomyces justiciae]